MGCVTLLRQDIGCEELRIWVSGYIDSGSLLIVFC
jgi:hypothetical protein